MGGVNSVCIPKRSPDYCRENHASVPKMAHKRNISATFNNFGTIEEEQLLEKVNINTATEEELMTLPGINRQTARSVVQYRDAIGNFKKVEDLALVSGVGATRLTQIRFEICVNSRKAVSSRGSTPRDSIRLGYGDVTKQRVVNVNTANVFQLMRVYGLTQVLAENMVAYRDRKGPFRSLDSLTKVKGVSPAVLGAIRHQLSLHTDEPSSPTLYAPTSVEGGQRTPPSAQAMGGTSSQLDDSILTDAVSDDVRLALADLSVQLEPLFTSYTRPEPVVFKFHRGRRRAVRVGTWNLEKLGREKVENPGVKEVICCTVLENFLGVLAVQDVTDDTALQMICDELNAPTLPGVRDWSHHKGRWKCVMSPQPSFFLPSSSSSTSSSLEETSQGTRHGFLYDASQGVSLRDFFSLDVQTPHTAAAAHQPFCGLFKVCDSDYLLVSMEVACLRQKSHPVSLPDVTSGLLQAIARHLPGEKDVVLLGSFGTPQDSSELGGLGEQGYRAVASGSHLSGKAAATSSNTVDHIWLSSTLASLATGHDSCVREGLWHPLIPRGWGWGGPVSGHCPLYTELFTQHMADEGFFESPAESTSAETSSAKRQTLRESGLI